MTELETIEANAMIAKGWAPIEYRSPSEIAGDNVYIQWNGITSLWVVLNHPTLSDSHNDGYATPLHAIEAINNATLPE